MKRISFLYARFQFRSVILFSFVIVMIGLFAWLIFTNPDKLPKTKSTILPIETHELSSAGETPESKKTIEKVLVQGEIINETGSALMGSFIAVQSSGVSDASSTFSTDTYGRFSFQTQPGNYILSASSPLAILSATRQLTITAGFDEQVRFQLAQARMIQGMVMNGQREPVAMAEISLFGCLSQTSQTVACASEIANLQYRTSSVKNGTFTFNNIWPGAYSLIVQASGYVPQRLKSVQTGGSYEVILQKTASLAVHIQDEKRAPVFLAAVQLKSVSSEGHYLARKETTQEGNCLFPDLQPGFYRISCSHADYLQNERSSADIHIAYSSETCELTLEHKGYSIRGVVVTDGKRLPVPDYTLTLFMQASHKESTTNVSGEFEFTSIPSGMYRIFDPYRLNKGKPYRITGDIPVKVLSQNVEGLEILAYPCAAVSGHVYNIAKRPVEGATVEINMGSLTAAHTDKNGYYNLPNLPPPYENGLYITLAFHPDYGWGSSRGFQYKPEDQVKDIDVTLGNEGIEIYGKVKDRNGKPIPKAIVNMPVFSFTEIRSEADESGFYKISKAPNHYTLTASAEGYLDAHRHPYYPCDKSKVEENFTLTQKSEPALQTISGVVIDKNNAPASEASVEAYPVETNMRYPISERDTETDLLGKFTLTDLDPQKPYRIQAKSLIPPLLETEAFGIYPGTQNLIMLLKAEPLEVIVNIDEQNVRDTITDKTVLFMKVLNLDDPSFPPLYQPLESVEQRKNQSFILNRAGNYLFSIYGELVRGKLIARIEGPSQNPIPLTLVLEKDPAQAMYYAVGRCLNPDSSPVTKPYRVLCRLIDPADPSAAQSVNAPQDGVIFAFMLNKDGVYEFLYLRQDGRVFNRSIVSLSRAQAGPWNKNLIVPGIALPDVIMPPIDPATQQ